MASNVSSVMPAAIFPMYAVEGKERMGLEVVVDLLDAWRTAMAAFSARDSGVLPGVDGMAWKVAPLSTTLENIWDREGNANKSRKPGHSGDNKD